MTEPSQPDTDSSTSIPWMRNGQTTNGWWRIDGNSERVGADFLTHPAAIVPDEADADLIERAVNNHAKLLAALKLAEWGGPVAGGQLACPVCRFGKRDGHEPNCKLAAAIKEAQS